MPIVKIEVVEGKNEEYKKALVKEVFDTLVNNLNVPPEALHVSLSEIAKGMYMADEHRTDDFCAIEINMWPGRSPEIKASMVGIICDVLYDKFAVDKKNVCVIIRDVPKSDLFYA